MGRSSNAALFFNIFVPIGTQRDRALEITSSQWDAIKDSHLASIMKFCNVFGDTNANVPECTIDRNCRILNRKENGDEKETLLELFRYCGQNSHSTVVYIHNKGSFHDTIENRALLEMHMRAQVQTETCRKAVESGFCNVCSARFSPLPHFHSSGNMWTAHCAYVNRLIPPNVFPGAMEDMIKSLQDNGDFMKEMFPCTGIVRDCVDIAHIGMQRYASEHWIHSHPTVVPCDVLPHNYSFIWNYNNIPPPGSVWDSDLHVGPRFPLRQYLNEGYLPENAGWFTLKGRLFEWYGLFKVLPSESSWVWYYYGTNLWQ
jgi:hypothetical protein